MKLYRGIAILTLILAATPVYAQMGPVGHNKAQVASGTVRQLDLRPGGSIMLDDGTTLTLPPDSRQLEWTSLPGVGQQVQVTYDEENGQQVVRSIEREGAGADSGGGN
jgi:hypothetical protein